MTDARQRRQGQAACTLCPACCPMTLVASGPDAWRSEPPPEAGVGLCPRGSVLGELLSDRRRILRPQRRGNGQARLSLAEAARAILDEAAGENITFIIDGNLPCEQLLEAAAWCGPWDQASFCFAVEPADRQLLLGTEASGAEYLKATALAECDGFVIVGDVFAANPTCARGIFDRRQSEARTPVVVIDPGAGTASKFATHCVAAPIGGELSALAAVARAAGVDPGACGGRPVDEPTASAAGSEIAGCRRLAVLVAAEYGRTAAWRQIGYLAGQLAKAKSGGVAPQTVGANVLAAVRIGERLGAVSPAVAMANESGLGVVIGSDVLASLGLGEGAVLAAAAALPNRTTTAAQIVLPTAMVGEMSGTYLRAGSEAVQLRCLLRPPAGVPTGSEIVAVIAREAGVGKPARPGQSPVMKRLDVEAPGAPPAAEAPRGQALLLGRQAIHAGCGEITGYGSWQGEAQPVPALRISPADAHRMELANLAPVTVAAADASIAARVRVAPELPGGTVVLPEGLAGTRALIPCRIDAAAGTITAEPVTVEIRG